MNTALAAKAPSEAFVRLTALACAMLIGGGCATAPTDYTAGASDVCEVHHLRMERTAVPIEYGLIRPDPEYLAMHAASTNSFPHAQNWVGGGCDMYPGCPRNAIVYSCPECRRAQDQWESAHKK